ncbi:MAG: hypothetical protein AB1642_13325 [Pseudomonadota bacterium]
MMTQPTLSKKPEMVTVSLTIEKDKLQKLHDFMQSETWEEAERLRKANLDVCMDSIEYAVEIARTHVGTSGGRVFASFLASLYNGNRVKVDVSDIRSLDRANFERLMNVMRLCYETHSEPHTFFGAAGGQIFEDIIKQWRLEKRRKAA